MLLIVRIVILQIPYKIAPRRPGDIPTMYSSAEKAKKELGWETTLGLDEMCKWGWGRMLLYLSLYSVFLIAGERWVGGGGY